MAGCSPPSSSAIRSSSCPAPTPGGLYFRQVAPLLREVARRNRIVGMDLVEVAPSYDFANGLTCITAGRLILNVLSASWGPDGALRRAA